MNKISNTKKQHIVLVLMATAAVIAGLWYFVVQQQYKKLETTRQKTLDMRDKVSKAEALLKKAKEIARDLEVAEKKLQEIEGGMASGDVYLWIINTVNDFNLGRRVTFLDFQRETLGEVGIIPKFPYKAAIYPLKGVAYFHDLGRFLADWENKFPYLRVQNLELSPVGKESSGEEPEKLNFKFEIVSLIKPTN